MIKQDLSIIAQIAKEKISQEEGLELIASENFISAQITAETVSILTNKQLLSMESYALK